MTPVSFVMVAVLLIVSANAYAQPRVRDASGAPAPPGVTGAQVTLKNSSMTISIERVDTIQRVATGEAVLAGDGFRPVSRPAETGRRLVDVLVAFSNGGPPVTLARDEVTLGATDTAGSNPLTLERHIVSRLVTERASTATIQGETKVGMTFEVPEGWLKNYPTRLVLRLAGVDTRFLVLVTSDSDILAASASGDIKALRRLLDAKGNVNAKAPQGETPLMMAAEHGHVEAVQLLIDRGADVNAVASGHAGPAPAGSKARNATVLYLRWTALMAAKAGGHTAIEVLLTQAGAQ